MDAEAVSGSSSLIATLRYCSWQLLSP